MLLLSLFGCGGSGGNSATGGSRGTATITIAWPTRSRVIPLAANSITCSLRLNGTTVQSIVTPRPSGTSQSDVVFNNLTPGLYTVYAYASPNADGTGVSQAEGTALLSITAGKISNFTVTMGSTVTSLTIKSPFSTIAKPGDKLTYIATAFSYGNMVLVDPSEFVWTTDSPSIVTIDPIGSNVVVTAVGSGNANVTVKTKYANPSASASLLALPVNLKYNWSATTSTGHLVNPAVAPDGSVIVNQIDDAVPSNCAVNCYDGSTGALKWSTKIGGPIINGAVFDASGNVFVGGSYGVSNSSTNAYVFSISLSSGGINWLSRDWNPGLDTPKQLVYGNGKLFVALDGSIQNLYALNASTGSTIWSTSTFGTGPNIAYFAAADRLLYSGEPTYGAYVGSTGVLTWSQIPTFFFSKNFTCDLNGDILIPANYYKLNKLAGGTGTLITSRTFASSNFPDYINLAPVVSPTGQIYLSQLPNTVWCLNSSLQTVLIVKQTPKAITSQTNNCLYITTTGGLIAYLNNSTVANWSFPILDGGYAAKSDGTVYVAHQNTLYSIHP